MNAIEITEMARVPLPDDTARRAQIIGMFAYSTADGQSFANYIYEEGSNEVLVPPAPTKLKLISVLVGAEIIDRRVSRPPRESFHVLEEFALREYQKEPAQELLEAVLRDSAATLEAGCGTGKTVVMTWAAGRLDERTLILVDQSDLVDQWDQAYRTVWGRGVHHIKGREEEFPDCCAVTFQLLWRRPELLERIKDEFGLLLVDESHVVKAETFRHVMFNLNNRYRLGCSATFFGKNIPQGVISDLVAPVSVRMSDPGALTPKVYFIETGVAFISDDPNHFGNKTMPQLADSPERNLLAFTMIKDAVAAGRRLIVIGIKNDQAQLLHDLCDGQGIRSTVYTGTTSKKRNAEVKDKFDSGELQVVLTSKKVDKGTDLPSADFLLRIKPSNNKTMVQQQGGRVVRHYTGKPQPIIVDLVDEGWLSERFASNRRKWYDELGYPVQGEPCPYDKTLIFA